MSKYNICYWCGEEKAWEEIDIDYDSEPLRLKEEVSDDSDNLLVSNNRDFSSCN